MINKGGLMIKSIEVCHLVNSVHLSYLRPLLKWRIMDVKSLMKESEMCKQDDSRAIWATWLGVIVLICLVGIAILISID